MAPTTPAYPAQDVVAAGDAQSPKDVAECIGARIPSFQDAGSVFGQLFPTVPWVRQRTGDPAPVPFTSSDLWTMLAAVPLANPDQQEKWAALVSLFQIPDALLRAISLDAGMLFRQAMPASTSLCHGVSGNMTTCLC